MGKKLKLTTFSVRMLLINRYFNGEAAKNDLKYEPIVKPAEVGVVGLRGASPLVHSLLARTIRGAQTCRHTHVVL